MAGESLVIAMTIVGLCACFFHAKRKNWAFAVLPLGLVPFITGVVMYFVRYIFKFEGYTFILPMTLTVISLIGSCIWIGMASVILIKTNKMKVPYIAVSVGFVFILSFVILTRYYYEIPMI